MNFARSKRDRRAAQGVMRQHVFSLQLGNQRLRATEKNKPDSHAIAFAVCSMRRGVDIEPRMSPSCRRFLISREKSAPKKAAPSSASPSAQHHQPGIAGPIGNSRVNVSSSRERRGLNRRRRCPLCSQTKCNTA
jgi:hypothetical protein